MRGWLPSSGVQVGAGLVLGALSVRKVEENEVPHANPPMFLDAHDAAPMNELRRTLEGECEYQRNTQKRSQKKASKNRNRKKKRVRERAPIAKDAIAKTSWDKRKKADAVAGAE